MKNEDIRVMIENVKNYSKFNLVFKIIKKYIEYTLNTEKQINEYVPITHIAATFKEVLNACEKENMYPEIYHNLPDKPYLISFLDKIDNYFNLDLLEKDGVYEIHRAYQKLRERDDYIRQSLKLIDTRIPYEYNMKHKVLRDLKSDKIKL